MTYRISPGHAPVTRGYESGHGACAARAPTRTSTPSFTNSLAARSGRDLVTSVALTVGAAWGGTVGRGRWGARLERDAAIAHDDARRWVPVLREMLRSLTTTRLERDAAIHRSRRRSSAFAIRYSPVCGVFVVCPDGGSFARTRRGKSYIATRERLPGRMTDHEPLDTATPTVSRTRYRTVSGVRARRVFSVLHTC